MLNISSVLSEKKYVSTSYLSSLSTILVPRLPMGKWYIIVPDVNEQQQFSAGFTLLFLTHPPLSNKSSLLSSATSSSPNFCQSTVTHKIINKKVASDLLAWYLRNEQDSDHVISGEIKVQDLGYHLVSGSCDLVHSIPRYPHFNLPSYFNNFVANQFWAQDMPVDDWWVMSERWSQLSHTN